MGVETILEDDRWQSADLPVLAERAAAATLAALGLDPRDFDVAVLGCDDARIAALNADFRGKGQPTNVLSWPSEDRAPDAPGAPPELPDPDGDPELGDIAIAYDTCLREAEAAGLTLANHATHLIVHGVLHLLGYDHITDQDAARMEHLEVQILDSLGIADPYRETG